MSDFQYTFRSYDALDLSTETQELFEVRDNQLENYIKNTVGSTSSTYYRNDYIRAGTAVMTLPAVNGFVTVNYASHTCNIQAPFSSTVPFAEFSITVTNGDYPANAASLAIQRDGLTGFRCYHTGGGTVGGPFRVNFIAMAFV